MSYNKSKDLKEKNYSLFDIFSLWGKNHAPTHTIEPYCWPTKWWQDISDCHFNQRKDGTTHRRKYVKSLLSNSCPTPIVLADVQSCMKYCEDTYGVDSADYLYFKDKDDVGYQYISIDGNNRSRAIARFSKNTFGLNTTEEHKISGIEQPAYRKWKPTNSTRTYNTLPDFIKTHFDSNIHVVVYKVVEASLTDLCELFININDGVTLNPQEKRNAIVCKLASIVRELSQDFEKFFSLYWTKESMKRRNHEEFIVSLWVHIQKSTGGNINKSERDYAYEFESNETVQNKRDNKYETY